MEFTQEIKDLLIEYFYKNDLKSFKETEEIFKTKSYHKIKHYTDFSRRESREHIIEYGDDEPSIDTVIKDLTKFKESRKNLVEGEHNVTIFRDEDSHSYNLVISFVKYHLIQVPPITEDSYRYKINEMMWKINHQPNGNDTKRYLSLIEKLKNNIT